MRLRIALMMALTAGPLYGQTAVEGDIILRGGMLFTSTTLTAFRNAAVVVRAGKLYEVGSNLTGRDLSKARVIQLSDSDFIMPGIIDVHAHYGTNFFNPAPRARIDETEVNPVLFLANGVTSTWPAGEMDPQRMYAMRRAIDAGLRPGPRVFNSGPYFGPYRRVNSDMTPARVCAEVDSLVAVGVRGFKAKRPSPVVLQALITCAHKHGAWVAAHLDSGWRNTVNPRDAILMGIDRVEHFLGGDVMPADTDAYTSYEKLDVSSPALAREIKLFIAHRVFFDATLSAYGYPGDVDPEVFRQWTDESRFFSPSLRDTLAKMPADRNSAQFDSIYKLKYKEVKAFYDAGGGDLITLGTDNPTSDNYLAGFGVHREMHALSRAGIPNAVVLKIATINNARALGLGSQLGTIETGKWADLIVVRGNPLRDIRATRNVRWVMKGGELYESEALFKSVEGKMVAPNAEKL